EPRDAPGRDAPGREPPGREGREAPGREGSARGQAESGGGPGALFDDSWTMPGERFATPPAGSGPRALSADRPFVSGDIADRGPLERGAAPPLPEPRAREAREVERQRAWRDQAARALTALKVDEGTAPINGESIAAIDPEADEDEDAAGQDDGVLHVEGAGLLPTIRVLPHGVSRKRIEQAVRELQLPVIVAR